MTRIFELTAMGAGRPKAAKTLQAEGVKSPVRITAAGRMRRARKNQERIERGEAPLAEIREEWTADGIGEILNRDLYRGVIVRGRVKRGKRGARRSAPRCRRASGSAGTTRASVSSTRTCETARTP